MPGQRAIRRRVDTTVNTSPIMLLSGTSNPNLAKGISEVLGEPPCDVTIKRFADGEIFVKIDENVRGRDVFLIQSTNPPAENMLELLCLIDAAKRASAARVTAVVPYYGYGRADRKDQPRVSIAAKLMANLITAAGADRLLSIDFHQHQIQGFFDIPVDHLYAAPVFRRYYETKNFENLVVVATDVSAAKMARGYARRLGGDLAIIDKRRPAANEAEVSNIVGEVEGKNCLIPDDMIDTAGTMASTVEVLRERGALDTYILATHALFSEPAVERLIKAGAKEIAVTDTVPLSPDKIEALPGLKILSVASLLAQAIESTHTNSSVSKLFK